VRLEDSTVPGLHQHRLVTLERAQRAHERVETGPVASGAPGAAVDNEVIGSFGDLGRGCSAAFEGASWPQPSGHVEAPVGSNGRAPSMLLSYFNVTNDGRIGEASHFARAHDGSDLGESQRRDRTARDGVDSVAHRTFPQEGCERQAQCEARRPRVQCEHVGEA